jgi:demethylmenaquinone methyltransferase / 2-methoxy-6-polyprenyl-1,4-benzoquinol methylase
LQVASRYDVMNDLMSGGLHRLWKDDFVRMAGIKAGVASMRGSGEMRLLDVAGGTGEFSLELLHV